MADSVLSAVREAMVDNYARLESKNEDLTTQLQQCHAVQDGMVRENSLLKDQLDQRTRDLQRVQAFAVRLSTQLEGLQDLHHLLAKHSGSVVQKMAEIRSEAMASASNMETTIQGPAGSAESAVDAAKPEVASPMPTIDEASLAALEKALEDSKTPHVTELPSVGL